MNTPIIEHEPLPEVLQIKTLRDPVVERHGHPVVSEYVETFWLPVLGPTTLWLVRRLVSLAEVDPHPVVVSSLALALGLGEGRGRDAGMTRAVYRIERFSAGRYRGDVLEVRTHLANVPHALMRRWPASLCQQHALVTGEPSHVN